MTGSSANQSAKKPLAASGAEVIFLLLLVVLGIGLCGFVEKNFNLFWPEPTEQRAFDTPRIKDKQEVLTRAENSIKETERQLDLVAIDQLKQQAVQKSLEPSSPSSTPRPAGATSVSGSAAAAGPVAPASPRNFVSIEAERTYQAAKTQEQTSRAVYQSLLDRIASLKGASEQISQDLKVEKQMASDKLAGERRRFLLAKFGAAVGVPLLVVFLVFLFGAMMLRLFAGKRVWVFSGGLPILFITGVLLILLTYQVFATAGAALIGIVVFLILLRRIRWTPALSKGTG